MSTKCEKCGIENQSDAKFCVSCGASLVEKVRVQSQSRDRSNTSVSSIANFFNTLLSLIVGWFTLKSLSVIQELCLMIFLKYNVMTLDEIELVQGLAVLIGIYFAFKIVRIINKITNVRTRIVFRVLIIVIGILSNLVEMIMISTIK